MVSVPITTRREVDIAPLGRERLRYEAPRNSVGPAVEGFGRALGDAAEGLDEIEGVYDQADVLNGDNTYAADGSDIATEFKNLKGDQPGRALPDYLKRLDDRQEALVGAARSERARNMMRRSLNVRRQNLESGLTAHADAEMFKFRDGALEAGAAQAVNDAIGSAGTDQFDVAVGTGLTRIEERAKLNGLPPEMVTLARSKFLDQVHGGVLDQMFAVPDPAIDDVGRYLTQYGNDMTPALRAETLKRIQEPLQGRVARSDADMVLGMAMPAATPDAPTAGKGTPNLDAITAQSESGGREYRSDGSRVTSPVGARGLMQVMPATARDPGFGIRASDGSPAEDARVGRDYRAKMETRYGGDLAKMWAAYNWGPGAVDKAVARHGDDWLANAPAETQAYVTKNLAAAGAETPSYTPAPREWDRPQIYRNLDETASREKWNPERTERTRVEIDRRINRDEGLMKEQRADADEAAANIVAAKGDAFRAHMIPRDVWNAMTPVQQREYRDIEEKLTSPEAIKPNGARAIELDRMARLDPEGFKAIDLAKEVGNVTPAERNSLSNQQADLLGPKGAKIIRYSDDARTTISIYATPDMKITGKDGDKNDYLDVHQSIQERLEAVTKGEREATDAERKEAFNYATMKIVYGDKKVRLYDMPLGDFSQTQRKQAEDALRGMGRDVTPEATLKLLREGVMRKARARGN